MWPPKIRGTFQFFRSFGISDLLELPNLPDLLLDFTDHLKIVDSMYSWTSSFSNLSNQLNFWKNCSDHPILILSKNECFKNTYYLQHKTKRIWPHCVVHLIETARDMTFTKSLNSPGEPFNIPWHSNVYQKVQWYFTGVPERIDM